jgi:hypothetical protein
MIINHDENNTFNASNPLCNSNNQIIKKSVDETWREMIRFELQKQELS